MGVVFWSLFTILTPIAARASYPRTKTDTRKCHNFRQNSNLKKEESLDEKSHSGDPFLILVRILMGLSEGVTMPAIHNMIGRWVPLNETSTVSWGLVPFFPEF